MGIPVMDSSRAWAVARAVLLSLWLEESHENRYSAWAPRRSRECQALILTGKSVAWNGDLTVEKAFASQTALD